MTQFASIRRQAQNKDRSNFEEADMSITLQTTHHPARMDSPMSDYFTDLSDSPDTLTIPSPTQKKLLQRLDSLKDWVLRQEPSQDTTAKAYTTISDLEALFVAPDTQSRQPADVLETDLFSPEEETSIEGECDFLAAGASVKSHDSISKSDHPDSDLVPITSGNSLYSKSLQEGQEVLRRVTEANSQLQRRLEEIKVRAYSLAL